MVKEIIVEIIDRIIWCWTVAGNNFNFVKTKTVISLTIVGPKQNEQKIPPIHATKKVSNRRTNYISR